MSFPSWGGGGGLDECAQAHGAGLKVGSTAQRTAPAHQPRQHVVPTTGGRASANGVAESRAWADRGHLAGCLGVTWAACTFCPGGACSVCRARNRGLQHAICSAPLPLVPSSLGCAEFQPPSAGQATQATLRSTVARCGCPVMQGHAGARLAPPARRRRRARLREVHPRSVPSRHALEGTRSWNHRGPPPSHPGTQPIETFPTSQLQCAPRGPDAKQIHECHPHTLPPPSPAGAPHQFPIRPPGQPTGPSRARWLDRANLSHSPCHGMFPLHLMLATGLRLLAPRPWQNHVCTLQL